MTNDTHKHTGDELAELIGYYEDLVRTDAATPGDKLMLALLKEAFDPQENPLATRQ